MRRNRTEGRAGVRLPTAEAGESGAIAAAAVHSGVAGAGGGHTDRTPDWAPEEDPKSEAARVQAREQGPSQSLEDYTKRMEREAEEGDGCAGCVECAAHVGRVEGAGCAGFDVGVGEREAEEQSSGERVGGCSGEMAEAAPSEREDRSGTAVWGRAQEQHIGDRRRRKAGEAQRLPAYSANDPPAAAHGQGE